MSLLPEPEWQRYWLLGFLYVQERPRWLVSDPAFVAGIGLVVVVDYCRGGCFRCVEGNRGRVPFFRI